MARWKVEFSNAHPQVLALVNIDNLLTACGWTVQMRGDINLYAMGEYLI